MCIRDRDRKGVYRLALEGKAKTVPGLQAPYEEPLEPDLVVDTGRMGPEECAELVIRALLRRFYGARRDPR